MEITYYEFMECVKEYFGEKINDFPPHFGEILFEIYNRIQKGKNN